MAEKSSNIDYKLMLPGVIVTAFIGVLLALFPTGGKAAVDTIFGILTHNFKWLFSVVRPVLCDLSGLAGYEPMGPDQTGRA